MLFLDCSTALRKLIFPSFASFGRFHENEFPEKLLKNCLFVKFNYRDNLKFLSHKKQLLGKFCKKELKNLRMFIYILLFVFNLTRKKYDNR